MVRTRLRPPTARAGEIRRSRLIAKLNDAITPVIAVSAPRGSGKTVALAQWVAQLTDTRWCWTNMRGIADRPEAFWSLVVAALRDSFPALDELAATDLDDRAVLLDTVVPRLVNGLASGPPVTLVLNGLDAIHDPLTWTSFDLFMRLRPESVRVVISTARPIRGPLPLLRASGDVTDLTEDDLRFTDSEAKCFIEVKTGRRIDSSTVRSLVQTVDGWAAGLRLTCPRDDDAADRSDCANAVVDYMRAELLDTLTQRQRDVLMHTCALVELTADACKTLTGADARSVLEELSVETLFVRRTSSGRWCCHPALRAALQTVLTHSDPAAMRAQYSRAVEWYRKSGQYAEAVSAAVRAGQTEVALDVVAREWATHPAEHVQQWLDQIPADLARTSPMRRIAAAVALALGDPTVEQLIGPGRREDAGLHAMLDLQHGELSRALRNGMIALAAQDPAEPWWAVLGRLAVGSVHLWRGDTLRARRELQTAAVEARRLRYEYAVIRAADALSLCLDLEGRSAAALRAAAEAVDQGSLSAVLAPALLTLAEPTIAASGRAELHDARATADPHQQAYLWWAEAELGRRTGDRCRQRRALTHARNVIAGLDPGCVLRDRLDLVKDRERQCALREPELTSELTGRERAILRALAGPLTLREIGDELHLSHNTVKSHVRSAFRKLDVHSRSEAVAAGRGSP